MKENIFNLPEALPKEFETFQSLIETDNILIEKIISTGQKTPLNQWLEDERNEWVILLQGEAEIIFQNDSAQNLKAGDYLFIPKNKKHRVNYTSDNPCCIWLAVYY